MTPEIISRADAKARGLKQYFTGKACKHGHVSARLTNGGCLACAKTKNVKYKARHPDKFRATLRASRLKNVEQVRAVNRKSYAKHRSERLDYSARRARKIKDLIAVLRAEMPELLMEFGL